MKKCVPSYNLKFVQFLFADAENLVMSSVAWRQLGNLGISLDELVQIIQALTEKDFVHSLSLSSKRHRWRDTYCISWGTIRLLLNFEMTEAVELMISLDLPLRRML